MEDFKYFNIYYKNPLYDSKKYYIKSTALLSDINIVQTCCPSTGSDSYEMFQFSRNDDKPLQKWKNTNFQARKVFA